MINQEKLATLGRRISLARERANLTDKQLSKLSGVMVKTIRNWEADRTEPRGNKLVMLAGALGVSLVWLISGGDDYDNGPLNLDETGALQVKLGRLQSQHEQMSSLFEEIQSDVQSLQGRIDSDTIAV